MRYHRIPDETVRRLPVYLRGAAILSRRGHTSISSKELAEIAGANPWQVRKDFSYFGDFGKPGVGYSADRLSKKIAKILHLNPGHKVALVGVGNLGRALLAYEGFSQYGLKITAAFDRDPKKIGKKRKNILVENITKINSLRKRGVHLAIIATPAEAAQEASDSLVKAGIKGILNFSPRHINVPAKVKVVSIDIAMDLARLPYYMPAG